MEYAVQDTKVSENLVQTIASARAPKTGFYAVFLIRPGFHVIIVIHRRCPCGLIVGGQRWIKSFVLLKLFSPSTIPDNR